MRWIMIGACALLWASPAHAQDTRATEGCSWVRETARRGREARDDSLRRALADAQRRVIRGTLAAAGVAEPVGVVVVTMDANGGAPAVSAFGTNFPVALLDPAAPELVVQARRTLAGEEVFDRLARVVRIDTVPLPAARADGRRLVCGPVATNRAELLRVLNAWIEANPDRGLRAREATVGMLLTRDGRVAYSEMAISTGDPAFDSLALATADRLTFRGPRSVDGVPYDSLGPPPDRSGGDALTRIHRFSR